MLLFSSCFFLSYSICLPQSSLFSWIASSAHLFCAWAQIAVPTPFTRAFYLKHPLTWQQSLPFLVEILCSISVVSYQLMSVLPLCEEHVPFPLWWKGTEVVGRIRRMGIIISFWCIFKTGVILHIFQMRNKGCWMLLFVRVHIANKCQKQELGTSWDWLHPPADSATPMLFVSQGIRTGKLHSQAECWLIWLGIQWPPVQWKQHRLAPFFFFFYFFLFRDIDIAHPTLPRSCYILSFGNSPRKIWLKGHKIYL